MLYRYERVRSTMDIVHELAAAGAAAGTIVVAGEQLEGRGSRGRPWHSPPGGLWLSLLLRPATAEPPEVISLRAGLVLAEAIEAAAGHPIQVKWPNDLMLDERKVGGILCEARWQGAALGWVAVGVGINVRNSIPQDLERVAVSLTAVRPDITVEQVLTPVVAALDRAPLGADRLSREELKQFRRRDWLRGRHLRQPVRGAVIGLNEDGTLMIRTPENTELSLRSGSVELASASPKL